MKEKCSILEVCKCATPCHKPLTKEEIEEAVRQGNEALRLARQCQPAHIDSGMCFR